MNKLISKENVGFGGLQWLYWSAFVTVIPFLVIYLKTKGYNEVQTGIVMAAVSLTSIFAQPFWGHYCDRRGRIRNVLAGCMLASAVVTMFIPVFYRSLPIMILIGLVISFTENSMSSIIDSWAMKIAAKKPWIDYGLTRGMGSLGFAFTAVVFGWFLDRFGYGIMFPTHFGIILVFVACCFFVERTNKSENISCNFPAVQEEKEKDMIMTARIEKINETRITKRIETKRETNIETPKLTFKGSGRFLWFLLSALLVFIGFRASGTFYPIFLKQFGGDNSALGISFFILAASEVPAFFLSKRLLRRYKDTAIIMVSLFFFIVKIALNLVVTSIGGLIAIQTVQALSYGLFLPASVYYISRIAPPGLSSTYFSIAVSGYFGIAGIFGSFGGGLIIDKFDIYTMFWICTALSILGFLVFLFSTVLRPHPSPH